MLGQYMIMMATNDSDDWEERSETSDYLAEIQAGTATGGVLMVCIRGKDAEHVTKLLQKLAMRIGADSL